MVAPERLLTVVMRHHERFYAPALADAPPRSIVAQPNNRGTAPAVLYALMRLGSVAPADPVVVLPSDHYVSDDEAFMARVEGALEAVGRRPEVVVLLGIAPDRPEVEYGWIEPAGLIPDDWPWPIYHVRRFWEKPSLPVAQRLEAAGWLWNSFVIVAQPSTLEQLIHRAMPKCSTHSRRSERGSARNGKTTQRAPSTDACRPSTSPERCSRYAPGASPCCR